MRKMMLLAAMLGACAPDPTMDDPMLDDDAADATSSDPMKLPKSIISFEGTHGWGRHHVEWHTERNWDLLDSSSLAWAKRQGWTRAAIQEGRAGNGLEFLAMHRVMLRRLVDQFPRYKTYFNGWETPPTDPRDAKDPLPHGGTTPFDDNKLDAISRLETQIGGFTSDDQLGIYIETSLKGTSTNPTARSTDKSAGIHNYVHNRFSDPSSAVDIGDPTVNLGNKRFWRLHGWIDQVWTSYRTAKGLTESDPKYQAALQAAAEHLDHVDGLKAVASYDPMPDGIRHPWAADTN